MSLLNTAVCALNGGNTGFGNCVVDFSTLNKGFLVPSNFVLTEAQLASKETALAALITAAAANVPSQRIYPLPETLTFTDNTEAAVMFSYGLGAQVTVRDGMAMHAINWKKGGLCLRNQLAKFNGDSWAWMPLDAQGFLIGTKVGKTMVGVPLNEFYQDPFKFGDGANPTSYQYKVSYNSRYINSDVAFIPFSYAEVAAISGLVNIVPEVVGNYAGANVVTLRMLAGCAKDNLYDLYSAALANVVNFTAINSVTGNVITITSVTVDANSKGFIFTLNASDPDYVANGFTIQGSTVSALAANNVLGFEILSLSPRTP